tara:strand:- start:2617 stop:3975 length:1359 start_codon:yes stop_codon:yes gene_type:complete
MATLTGQSIKDSYKSILKTESTVGFNSTTPTRIEDGDGNQSSLSLGKTKVNIIGSLALNLSSISTPRANLHIVGTSTQAMLIQSTNGYNKFYVGDFLSGYNVKMGDIDSSSSGNNTYFCVQDSNNRITSKTTYFGVNQTVPTCTLHVGSNSGTALFSLGTSTDVFKITSSSNTTLFTVDSTNDKVSINADVEVKGNLRRSSERYYLEEFFKRLPKGNADILDASEATRMPTNRDFELVGTNAGSGDAQFSSNYAGIQIQTDGTDNDQVIIAPHLDARQSAWSGTLWGTENQVEWECAITTHGTITDYSFHAGLKLTNTPVYATDADQAYFLFCTDDDQGALTTNANLHFVYSNNNTDYITDLGIAVAASTTYRLRIEIDSSRQASVFVNDVQYGLGSATTAGGVTQNVATTKSLALADDHDFIPYIGVQQMAGSKTTELVVHYQKMSRILFE